MTSQQARQPKYRMVGDHLDGLLAELGEGAAIPAERELASRFSVSRETVRQAVRQLVVAGRLRREGRGTVVAGPKICQPLELGSYTEALRGRGHRPGRRLVTAESLEPDGELRARLGMGTGEPVIHLERLLLADDLPVGLEDTYLPAARFPRLLAEFDPAESLYAYIGRVGVRFGQASERIETVLAAPREAMLLQTNPSAPMLLLHRTSLDTDGCPVERVRSLFRGDRFSFVTTLYPAG